MNVSEQDSYVIQTLREFISHSLRHHNVPGLNIALALGGKIILEEGFGCADLAKQVPMTAQTVTRAGSMSKLYAATAVMQLVEADVMQLHEPINRYLPDFQINNPLGRARNHAA